jgi:predicted amidohydrolase YtcJ
LNPFPYFSKKTYFQALIFNMKYLFPLLSLFVLACAQPKVDYIIVNAKIITVDSAFSIQEAMAVQGDKILAVGKIDEISKAYAADTIINAEGKTILPGLIDAHCHFLGYAKGLAEVNLFEVQSEQDMIARVQAFAKTHPEGWIVGRGWDQNKWLGKQFPSNTMLNQLFPNRPVYLVRVDGHATLVNQAALTLAGVNEQTSIVGGKLLQSKGKLTGLLIDKATELVEEKIENYQTDKLIQLLKNAEKNTFEVGLTTMVEAGLDLEDVLFLDSISQTGDLKSSIYAMLNPKPECFEYIRKHGFILHPNFWVQSVKVYADGALGSRGALLHQDYSDDKGNKGLLLYKASYFDSVATLCKSLGLQMNTHCIGDSSNSKSLCKSIEG